MSLLRVYCSLSHSAPLDDQTQRCLWALIKDQQQAIAGEGRIADLPQRADRVQLILPATQVLFVHARIPPEARRRGGSVLAFAVEEKVANEPEANQVNWLGAAGDEDVLAVVDKSGLEHLQQALASVGIHADEVHSETLLLPVQAGEWSLAWNGSDGFVRSGEFEGAAMDCGDHESPPLSLVMMLKEAKARDTAPASLALYVTAPDVLPNIPAWQDALGVTLRIAGIWDWRTAAPDAGVALVQQRQNWRAFTGIAKRLRPAAWILGAALTLYAVALVIDWTLLAGDQRTLRQHMDARFRAAFPDAVAVVDPVLQMRRKLAEARHAAGLPDGGDFLPMIERVHAAAQQLPAGVLRTVSYERGRMTLEFAANDKATGQRIVATLIQSGLSVDALPSGMPRSAGAPVIVTVRAL